MTTAMLSLPHRLFTREKRLGLAGYALLLLFSLALFLPGFFTIPPLDRDESRFAQASKQMLETGDLIDIHFLDEARNKKPAGIYWLQAGAVKLWQMTTHETRDNVIWPYRIPSLIGAILSVLLTAQIGARLFNPRVGFMAAVLLAGSLLLNIEARMATTDAALLAMVLLAQAVLAKGFCRAGYPHPLNWKDFVLFWGAVAAGILIKGPIILLSSLGTLLLLRLWKQPLSWFKHLRPLLGIAITLALVLPWFYLITQHSEGAFLRESVGHDLLGKIWQGQNWGGAPPGYHLLAFWAVFWPSSLIVLLAMPWIWQKRKEPAFMFLLAWITPVWVVFEFVYTKLPHYVLPAFPALALMGAAWLFAAPTPQRPSWWKRVVLLIWSLVSVGLCVLPIALPAIAQKQFFFSTLFLGSLGLGAALAAAILFHKQKPMLAIVPMPLASFSVMLALFGFLLPGLTNAFLSPRITALMPPLPGCAQTLLETAGYDEPSLAFLAGTKTEFFNNGGDLAMEMIEDYIEDDKFCSLALVEKEQEEAFLGELRRDGSDVESIAHLEGFNYGRGKKVFLNLYRMTMP